MFESGLWVIILEMLCVIALAVFIVWWTWPRQRKSPPAAVPPAESPPSRGARGDEADAQQRDAQQRDAQ